MSPASRTWLTPPARLRVAGPAATGGTSAVLGLLTLLGACGSATFADGVYYDGTVRYRVGERGAGWQRVDVDDTDLAFHHPSYGTMGINSTCEDYEDVPHAALLNHLLFGTTDRDFRLEETVTLDGRGARHVVVDVQLDGVPLTVEIYLLTKDGCIYDLTHVVSRDAELEGREAFHRWVRGFAVLDTRLD